MDRVNIRSYREFIMLLRVLASTAVQKCVYVHDGVSVCVCVKQSQVPGQLIKCVVLP